MLLVIGISNETREALVWDSDDLTLERLPLGDVIRYHREVEKLNLMVENNQYIVKQPKLSSLVIDNPDFILCISDGYWYVYADGAYSCKSVYSETSLIVPIRNCGILSLSWFCSSSENNALKVPLLTRLRPITRHEFKSRIAFNKESLKFSQ